MIKAVLLDIDGVLTDGTVMVNAGGEETKTISFDDIDAIFELKRNGIKIGFMTGEDTTFADYVKKRFTPDFFIAGCKDKLAAFQELARRESLDESDIAFAGDSKKDVALLEYLSCSYAPGDADAEARASAKTVLKAGRGRGAIMELARHILTPATDSTLAQATKASDDTFWLNLVGEHIVLMESIKKDTALLAEIARAADVLVKCFKNGNKLLVCGNGGSAADSQHIAAEFVNKFLMERPALDAEALTVDTSILTAIGNDYDFGRVFSRQVEAEGKHGDVLLAISTSGTADNVIAAILKAKHLGMKTIALTGQRTTTELAKNADYRICVPSSHTPRIQEAHILIAHMLCEYIERKLFSRGKT